MMVVRKRASIQELLAMAKLRSAIRRGPGREVCGTGPRPTDGEGTRELKGSVGAGLTGRSKTKNRMSERGELRRLASIQSSSESRGSMMG